MSASRWKKFLSVTVALCLTSTMMPAVAFGAAEEEFCVCGLHRMISHKDMIGHTSAHYVSYDRDAGQLDEQNSTLQKVTSAGAYMLAGDQVLKRMWETPEGETTIWTMGNSIRIDSATSDYTGYNLAAITVKPGSTLNLSGYDTTGTASGKVTGDPHTSYGESAYHPRYSGIYVAGDATLNLYGVDVSMTGKDTAGIIVGVGGTVNIYAGAYNNNGQQIPTKIEGNSRYGIENLGGTVNIYGGEISGNAYGGVYVAGARSKYVGIPSGSSVVNMYSGNISGNVGSGVWMDDQDRYETFKADNETASLNMYGGSIVRNGGDSLGKGGGVYIGGSRSTMTLHGEGAGSRVEGNGASLDPIAITGNKAKAGQNVYVDTDSDSDPRISVIAGDDPRLGMTNPIEVLTRGTENGTANEVVITTGAPESADVFASDSDEYAVTTTEGAEKRISLFKKSAVKPAPVKVKEVPAAYEYTGKVPEASIVDDGTTVEGTWSWKEGGEPSPDIYGFDGEGNSIPRDAVAVFTPADTLRYTPVEREVKVAVTPKPVTVSFEKYEDGTCGGGTYGGALKPAVPVFKDSEDNIISYISHVVRYSNKNMDVKDVPNKAGDYTVTVGLSDSNYRIVDGGTTTITVGKQQRNAPAVTATDETVQGKGDGKIIGLTTDMEISSDGGNSYSAVTGLDIDRTYAPGSYSVRYIKDENHEDAGSTEVTIKASTKKLKVSVPANQQGYTLTTDSDELAWHGSTTLHYALIPGYTETPSFKVLLNGSTDITESVKQEAGYSLTDAESDATVTVQGVEDITAPEVELSLSNASWKQFFNAISFGLFFKDDVDKPTATVKASDDGSGLGQAAVLVSRVPFDSAKTASGAGDWRPIELDSDGMATFDIGESGRRHLYVRVSDMAGNVTVVNPDTGVVVYRDSEAKTAELTYEKGSEAPVVANLELNGNPVKELYSDDHLVDAANYTVDNRAGTISFEQSYLDTLAVGSHTIRVAYNPQGAPYRDYLDGSSQNINSRPADIILTLTITEKGSDQEASGGGGPVEGGGTPGAGGGQETPGDEPSGESGGETPGGDDPSGESGQDIPGGDGSGNNPTGGSGTETPGTDTPGGDTPGGDEGKAEEPGEIPGGNDPLSGGEEKGQTPEEPSGGDSAGSSSQETPGSGTSGGSGQENPGGGASGGTGQNAPGGDTPAGSGGGDTPGGTGSAGGAETENPGGGQVNPGGTGEGTRSGDNNPARGGDAAETAGGTPGDGNPAGSGQSGMSGEGPSGGTATGGDHELAEAVEGILPGPGSSGTTGADAAAASAAGAGDGTQSTVSDQAATSAQAPQVDADDAGQDADGADGGSDDADGGSTDDSDATADTDADERVAVETGDAGGTGTAAVLLVCAAAAAVTARRRRTSLHHRS